MTLYYFESEVGCGIRRAKNIRQAEKMLEQEVGSLVELVRKATIDDIGWIAAMGGDIPDEESLVYSQNMCYNV